MDPQAEELEWIQQALGGQKQAFGMLMQRYTGAVYGLSYRMLGNPQDAEDATQEIFLRAYSHLSAFDRSRKLSTWLLSIASNYCIDRLRRRHYNWMTLDDVAYWLPSERAGPERTALETEQRALVRGALQRLPDTYRLVAVLRYMNELSYDEIGQITGLPESTIKTRLHRARNMLAEFLGSERSSLWDTEITS
ncbi:sigma-70 family RNA polymerase sigma factor [Chloroflexia bacterium SDU3-3]|nr:sigma-70 family RNA polymerase sigma factor [Chloroflexia bacterium SDU3-3]